ncbi:MAG: histidine kinase [Dictyoglomus sp.]|nr:histidine kinase [Dictyoglomus sp.]MCX7942865.1 histidine kinase [Dictyoglomaceae bacterium]MDW8189093.1 histidine kinase [Dictyoglomus sp.]
MALKVVEIIKDLYLIQTPELPFVSNSYLLTLSNNGNKINILIDPIPLIYFNDLTLTLKDLIGGAENLNIIYVNHQDPDLTSSLPGLMSLSPNSILLSSEDTWRLIRNYGLDRERFQAVEYFPNKKIILRTGHAFQFVPTPFCHFRGACMIYYPTRRVLFSGDLLGGLVTKAGEDIYATKDSWEGIKIFHQIYIPTREALRLAVDKIGRLEPIPELILPQHGDIIKGDLIVEFLKRLNDLEVGLEHILTQEKQESIYLYAFNEILQKEKERFGEKFVMEKLESINSSSFFPEIVHFENGVALDFRISPISAIGILYKDFTEDMSLKDKETIKSDIVSILSKYNLDIPEEILEERASIWDNFRRILRIFQR